MELAKQELSESTKKLLKDLNNDLETEVENQEIRNPGIISCDCNCHKTIEQGGANRVSSCIHCQLIK